MKENYILQLKELKHYYLKGDFDGFISKEETLKKDNFYIEKYQEITGFNFLHSILAFSTEERFVENLKLTQYIEDKTEILELSLAALFLENRDMVGHLNHYYKIYGKPLITAVFNSRRLATSDSPKDDRLMNEIIKLDKILNTLINELGVTNFTSIESLAFLNEDNVLGFKDTLKKIFNKPTNYITTTVGKIIQDGNIRHLNVLYIVKLFCPEISDDKLINVPSGTTGNTGGALTHIESLKDIFANENLERKFNFITKAILEPWGNDTVMMNDTIDMYRFLTAKGIKVNLKKINSFKELHDTISKTLTELSQENETLNSQLEHLNGKTINDYVIHIPKDNQTLIDTGKTMKICVGNGTYFSKIMLGKSEIILLMKNNQPEVCIELKLPRHFVQVRTYDNGDFNDKDTIKKLENLL